ncbi:MAG TPA: helix-turn-helix domain-containing protein [Trebonia sp.]|jgi:AraC-like DNA-binding protein|nr:helix-turn-helix domain-containing protein [Trebonia sp.]
MGAVQRGLGRGVLRPAAAPDRFSLRRHEPPADLAPFVDFCWVIRWDLRGAAPHEQQVLPHPNVNLAFEDAGAHVYGVDTKIFTRRLTGRGQALGVRFRSGGFRPFCAVPVAALNDRVVPVRDFFGPAADQAGRAVMAAADDDAGMIAAAAAMLRSLAPGPGETAALVAAIVARITGDHEIRRVSQLTAEFGVPERQLQRLFTEYVGVSPKWVMRRARLHEAALRADAGEPVNWARLAADLGYADQAHLSRDFTATLGVSPARYAASR